MNKRNRSKGMSLAEVLLVIGIVAILAAVSFVAVFRYQRSMHQLEMDGIAKEIFVAAQNHLSAAEEQAYLSNSSFGSPDTVEPDKGIYYFIVGDTGAGYTDPNGDTVLSLMLPFGSVDETVRLGGSYIVRYQKYPAQVLDVFYAERNNARFGHVFTAAEYDDLMNDYRGEDKKADRREYGADKHVIGYFGGVDAQALATVTLEEPTVVIHNEDTLWVEILNPNYTKNGKLNLVVEGVLSGARQVISLDASSERVTYTMDDVTQAGLHFAELFGEPTEGHFIPGENISVKAVAFSSSQLANVATSATRITNSLFASGSDSSTALVSSIRHLQNLDRYVSKLDDGDAGNKLTITSAKQTDDLSWTEFVANTHAGDNGILVADTHSLSSEAGTYRPVGPEYSLDYDGQGHSVSDLVIRWGGPAGMFGTINNSSISNLELLNFNVTSTSGNAGALAGTVNGDMGTDIFGVLARNDAGDASLQITGTGNVGGLVGQMTRGHLRASGAAVYVRSTSGNAGGLLGYGANGLQVEDCYAGGHTENGVYLTDETDGAAARINVIGAAAAGGLIGEGNGIRVAYSYSTASASGDTAGGLAGKLRDGSLSNSYSTGLVKAGTDGGAFLGVAEGAPTFENNQYFEIINEGSDPIGVGAELIAALPTPLDADLTAYHAFIDAPGEATAAAPYDGWLVFEFKGKTDMPGLARWHTGANTSDWPAYMTTHYGDWPSPETKVINPDSLRITPVNHAGSHGAALAAGVSHARLTVDGGTLIPSAATFSASAIDGASPEYQQYLEAAAAALGVEPSALAGTRFLDLSILDGERELQPDSPVKVELKLTEGVDTANLRVLHFGKTPEILPATLEGDILRFGTSGFSVYAILEHEGDEAVATPRVEFHFLSDNFSDIGGGKYTAGPYRFPNQNNEMQTTQLITNGETLEGILNPPNKKNPDKFFYGWYVVNVAADGVAADGTVTYTWDNDPVQIQLGKTVTFTVSEQKVGGELTWICGDATDEGVLDSEGRAHVYLAPIYENYYFLNFHLAAEGSGELANTIVARKLIVLGGDDVATMRIGDVVAPSTDPKRLVFTGWATELYQGDVQERVEIPTLDEEGEEIPSAVGLDGYYIDVSLRDVEATGSIDLYPIFTESRWIYFNTGKVGNGATYVPAKYLYTSEVGQENSYFLTDLPVSRRTGFTFQGWFADASIKDLNGEYVDGTRITDENGHIVSGPYTKYDTDGVTPLYQIINGKLYVYKALSYEQGLTLYAHWQENDQTKLTVLIWKQKITDSKDAEDKDKKYDYESTVIVDPCTSGQTLTELQGNGILGDAEQKSYTGFHYRTSEMTARTVAGDGTTVVNVYYDRDLMTINFYTNTNLDGFSANSYEYNPTNSSYTQRPEQYGIVGGRYVPLTYKQGSGYTYNLTYSYTATSSDTASPQFALVNTATGNGEYVQLDKTQQTKENTRWAYYTGRYYTEHFMDEGRTDGKFYYYDEEQSGYQKQGRRWVWVDVYTDSGYTEANPPAASDRTTYYCLYNNKYYELSKKTTTTTTYVWTLNGAEFTGTRYRRSASGVAYTGTRYTASGSAGSRTFTVHTAQDGVTQYGIDSRGGHVELTPVQVTTGNWYYTDTEDHYYPDPANNGQNGQVAYGLIDGQYVELTPVLGEDYAYSTVNNFATTNAEYEDQPVQYALVNGEYVQLQYAMVGSDTGRIVEYVYTPSNSTRTGYYYILLGNNFTEEYLYRNNNRWYRNRTGWYNNYTYSNEYTGPRYTAASGEGIVIGQYYNVVNGEWSEAANGNYAFGENDVIYGLGGTTMVDRYGWSLDGTTEYTGGRYVETDGTPFTGTRLLRSGDAAPYTYVATSAHEGFQYALDGNGGHVALTGSRNLLGFEFNDQPYTGTVYSNGPTETETVYTGPRYTRDSGNFNYMLVFTGLYAQTLEQNGYVWPADLWWYDKPSGQSNRTRTTFLDAFLFAGGGTVETLYGYSGSGNNHIYFYKESLTSGTYVQTNDVSSGSGAFNISDKYNGFTAYQYSTNGSSWNSVGNKSASNGYYNNGNSVSFYSNLHIRFKRNSYQLTFNVNYPNMADVTFSNGQSANKSYTVLFEKKLTQYGPSGADYFVPVAPDNYVFAGWYEDDVWEYNEQNDAGRGFDFDQIMPSANKIVYAKWQPVEFRIRIDPNGGVIDHIDHTDPASFRPDNSGYRKDQSTYFNAYYNEPIGEYSVVREYVEITAADAAELAPNEVFYYMNAQYYDPTNLHADARNALYLTEAELESYYEYYKTKIRYNTTELGFAAWKNQYLKKDEAGNFQLYRHTRTGESYVCLGWYQVFDLGTENERLDAMPYNFSNPTTSTVDLRAVWRLDGGYLIQYTPEYVMPDGNIINGSMASWYDPSIPGARYADNATTNIYRQPTDLTVNGFSIEDDRYMFLGWRLVSVKTVSGNLEYTPLEPGVFYNPSDFFTIRARYADPTMTIHMQAVYEEKDAFTRRPSVTTLTLDANKGYFAGASLDEDKGALPEWPGPGASVPDYEADQIQFTHIQNSTGVYLSRYATPFTRGERSNCGYFSYDVGYRLIGFDEDADPRVNNYVPDFPADGIISIRRNEDDTVYAVWEPLVYLNVVNNTNNTESGLPGKAITFGLSSDDGEALYVVNLKNGEYSRVPIEDLNNITVEVGETLHLAIPYGKDKHVTLSGVNDQGTGILLHVDSSLEGTQRQSTTAKNGKTFSINETLLEHEEGITVTFTAEPADRTMVFQDNTNGDGTGGVTEEFYYKFNVNESDPMPRRGRVGYEFLGWALTPDATAAQYFMDATITDLDQFYGDQDTDNDDMVTLYGVWKSDARVGTLKVYKNVPLPGNQTDANSFTFDVVLNINARRNNSGSYETFERTQTVTLAHNQYLQIVEETFQTTAAQTDAGVGNRDRVRITVQIFQSSEDDTDQPVGAANSFIWQSANPGTYNTLEPKITITESGSSIAAVGLDHYDTALEVISLIQDGGSGSYLTVTDSTRKISWDNPANCGGTVLVTNTRKTADVTVKKELVDDVFNPIKAFNFTVSVALPGGEGYQLPSTAFSVANGTDGYKLAGIPTGSVLTVVEENDQKYTTTAAATGSTGSFDAAAKTYTLTVTKDSVITFTNTLKKQQVKIVKVGSEGQTDVEAQFDFVGGSRTFLSGKYTTPTNNVIYEGDLHYSDEYLLTEKWVMDGYRPLEAPAHLTVDDGGVTVSGTSGVTVTGPDGSGTYTVTVVNQKTAQITVTKNLIDPYTPGQLFGFTLSATFNGETLNLGTNAAFSMGGGGSRTLTLPVGTQLTVTELANNDYITTVTVGSGAPVNGNTHTFTVTEDATVTVTNTRKTADITVRKELKDVDTDEAFTFRATFIDTYNRPLQVVGLTDSTGIFTFQLTKNTERVLPGIPLGTTITLEEVGAETYTATIVAGHHSITGTKRNTASFRIRESDRVLFTNAIATTDFSFRKIDGSGAPLANSYFALYTDAACTAAYTMDGHAVTAASGGDGTVTFRNVLFGSYYMRETAAPGGYALSDTCYQVTVTAEQTTIRRLEGGAPAGDPVTAVLNESETRRKVILKKVNAIYEPLENATFTIYRLDLTKVAEGLTSGDDGAFYIGGLPIGTYYLQETGAPDGYKLPAADQYFKIEVTASGAQFLGLVPYPGV